MWGVTPQGLSVISDAQAAKMLDVGFPFVEWTEKSFTWIELFSAAFPSKSRKEIRSACKQNALKFGSDRILESELNVIETVGVNDCNFGILSWGKRNRELVVFLRTL